MIELLCTDYNKKATSIHYYFGNAVLVKQLQENAAVIDIASAPGGVDFQALECRNIRARLCPGLPGRYSPLSSALILYEAVMEHIRDSQTQ